MGEKTIRICDLCEMDGEAGVKAVGYYSADNGEFYDVCKKHAEDVKKVGKVVELHWES